MREARCRLPRATPGLVSLVIPLYNEEDVLSLLVERISGLLDRLPCAAEIIFVDDGSSDRSLEQLHEIATRDTRFRVIGLAQFFLDRWSNVNGEGVVTGIFVRYVGAPPNGQSSGS